MSYQIEQSDSFYLSLFLSLCLSLSLSLSLSRSLSLSLSFSFSLSLSLSLSLCMYVCVSFSRVPLSAFAVTPDFTDHGIVSMPCLNDSLYCSVVYLPVHFVTFCSVVFFCDFKCVSKI